MNSLSPTQEDQIQQFLKQELHGAALDSFQAQLRSDPGFAGIVKERAEMIAVLRAVEALQAETPMPAATSRPLILRPRFQAFLVAASVGLLLLTSLLWLRFNGSTASQIAAENFEYRRLNSLLYASRSQSAEPVQNQKIDSLLYSYQQLLAEDSTNATLYFTLGDLQFYADQADAAIESYQQGLKLYPEDAFAKWNLSLSYLKKGDTEQAISLLETLEAEGTELYSDRATEILKNLRSIGFRWNLEE